MPRVPTPPEFDAAETIQDARRHVDDGGQAGWGSTKGGHGRHKKNPCGYPPSAPTGVAFAAKAVEAKTHLEFSGRVKFDVVTTNEGGGPTKPDRYDVQLRVTDSGGTPLDLDDVTTKPKLHYRRASPPKSRRVSAAVIVSGTTAKFTCPKPHGFIAGDKVLVKDMTPAGYNGEWTVSGTGLTTTAFRANIGTSPADATEFGTCEEANDWLHVNIIHLPRPKKWYWQARVRCVDRNNCAGDWSNWTSPVLPWTGADPAPPVPTGLVLSFDRGEKGRWDRNRAVCTWNEVKNFDYPGTVADDEDDVIAYQVRLYASANGSSWTIPPRKRKVTALDTDADATCSVVFGAGIKKKFYYRFDVRTIDRYNRKSAWASPTTAAQPDDTTPPGVPTGVEARGIQDAVELDWDDNQDPADSELVIVDLAYYQAKVTTNPSPGSGVEKFWRMRENSRVRFTTTSYKQRYWLHVRSVDSSDNKSAWVTAGPVRPGKVPGVRVTALGRSTGIDWSLDSDEELGQPGYTLAGGGENSIYATDTTATVVGLVEGDDTEGTAELLFTTGSSNSMTVLGIAMRAQDVSNFVGATYDDQANQIRLEKRTAGTFSTLATWSFSGGTAGQADRTYRLKVVISGNQYQVYLDGSVKITHTDSSFSTQTKFGPYIRRGSGLDTGSASSGSRIDRWRWTALDSAFGVVVDDEFDRATSAPTAAIPGFSATPGTMDTVPGWVVPGYTDDGIPSTGGGGLGTASSGQAYTTSGNWVIEQTETPFAIFGSAVELPMYQAEDPDIRFEFVKFYNDADTTPTYFGLGGKSTTGLYIEIAQPTRFFVNATANVQNGDAVDDHNIRFYVMGRVAGGTWEWSRQTNIWSQANDAGAGATNAGNVQIERQRNGATMGVFFFDATYDSPVTCEFAWGYTIGDNIGGTSTGNNVAVRNQHMIVTAAYSPSYSPDFSTTKRSRWTTSNVTREAYRRSVTSPGA